MEDSVLIDLYWNRDERALSATKRKYGPYLCKIAYNILQRKEDVEECENDTYLRVWNSIPEDRPHVFIAYIGRIIRNLSLNRYNRDRAQKRGGNEMDLIYDELEYLIGHGRTPESALEQKELIGIINDFLASLKSEQRVVFVKRYWYADSIACISEETGFSEGKVKTMLFRLRNNLRDLLEREGVQL